MIPGSVRNAPSKYSPGLAERVSLSEAGKTDSTMRCALIVA